MGKRVWFGAVKKAFRSDKKHKRAKRPKWMCGGTSFSLEEEEEMAAVMATEAKLSEALSVPIKEVRIANHALSLSPPATQPEILESEPDTEPKPPEPLSPQVKEIKVAHSISASIKGDMIFKTIEHIKEANSFETVLAHIREEKAKLTENVARSKKAAAVPENLAEISFLPPFLVEETRLVETGDDPCKHAYSVAIAKAVAAEASAAAAWAAVQVVRLETAAMPWMKEKSKEEIAAIKIQSVFRGYLARRALRALKGLARLTLLIKGSTTKHQLAAALRCVKTMSKVHAQIRSRRMKMSEENQTLQHHRLLKQQKELECLKPLKPSTGDGWDHSIKSKEQQAATLSYRQDAAMRREKALAYAFSHQQQWRNSIKLPNPAPMETGNPNWGWNWLERWMFTRPWENRCVDQSDAAAMRTAIHSAGQIITKPPASREKQMVLAGKPVGNRKKMPPCSLSRDSRPSLVVAKPATVCRKPWVPGGCSGEDSKNMIGMDSQGILRHSLNGYSIRDVERNVSLSTLRSSSLSAKSTRDRSNLGSLTGSKPTTGEKTLDNWAKKRSSFSGPVVYGNNAYLPSYRRL